MRFRYIKASHLDASAAVKLVLQERGSEQLRSYFASPANFYITSVCLAEALGVFKRKRLRDEISEKQYLTTCYLLLGYLRNPPRIRMDEIEVSSVDIFAKSRGDRTSTPARFVGLASVGQREAWQIQLLRSGVQNPLHHS